MIKKVNSVEDLIELFIESNAIPVVKQMNEVMPETEYSIYEFCFKQMQEIEYKFLVNAFSQLNENQLENMIKLGIVEVLEDLVLPVGFKLVIIMGIKIVSKNLTKFLDKKLSDMGLSESTKKAIAADLEKGVGSTGVFFGSDILPISMN